MSFPMYLSSSGLDRGFWTRGGLLAIAAALNLSLMPSCSTAESGGSGVAYSLAATRKLPGNDIKEYVSASTWQQIKDLEVSRYAGMDAEIKNDGSLALGSTFAAYPNHDWDEIARGFAKKAVINATRSVGTQLRPKAEVYVIFFDKVGDQRPVAIYARQINIDPQRWEGNTFVGRRINTGETVEWARWPQYFQFDVYY